MSTPAETKRSIENALGNFSAQPLAKAGISLFDTLGYRSSRRVALASRGFDELADLAGGGKRSALEPELKSNISDIQFLLQLTGDEIQAAGGQDALPFQTKGPWDGSVIESYLFFAIELKPGGYSRTDLSKITRAVNRLFAMPAMLLFRHGDTATLAVIHRRLHKLDAAKDVLEKVTLIKDVRFAKPHRAHIEILFDLSLPELIRGHKVTNFVQLHNAWRKTLDSSELNKRFFKEIADWYFWSLQNAKFPEPDFVKDSETYQAQNVIRLITRLIFCWFLKEKGLIPAELFDEADMQGLLAEKNPKRTTYYRAILQNLFFATLNTPMNSKDQPQNRRFCRKTREDHMIHSYYRHEDLIADKKRFLDAMSNIPFLNGGLFECLDRREKDGEVRIDGFSTDPKKCPAFPDFLFFAEQEHPDLNAAYGTADAKFTVRGILKILDRYKFTVAENTPIEEEVALDPELLGRVFENLLAAYNPETGVTARKQTGSFYTPREIVNYMVDEALIACLKTRLTVTGGDASPAKQAKGKENPENPVDPVEENLRHLFAYNDEPHRFTPREVDTLIAAIDDIKILDPACGSGAFPMGILHQLVHILAKLDPHNKHWKERQLANARAMTSSTARKAATDAVEAAFDRNDDNYGRKLYLIENCIYGVDIQPIAVQIAKLRFFISLIVNQSADDAKPNRDILSLPNLETKFVAANTLIGLPKPTKSKAQQMGFGETEIVRLEKELRDVRRQHFSARSWPEKRQLRDSDAALRKQIADRFKSEWGYEKSIAEQVASWNPYDQNASGPFFDPEWMFNITGGFDLAIGNPPYVKEDTNKNAFDGLRQAETYQGKMDLWYLFGAKSLDLLKHHGILCFIATNNWISNDGASKFRNKVLAEGRLIAFIDFCNYKVFSAGIQTMVCVIAKDSDPPRYELRYGRLIDEEADLDQVVNFINSKTVLHTQSFERFTVAFHRQDFVDSYIKFMPPLVSKVIDKIAIAGTFRLSDDEVFSGIDVMQDFVSKASASKLGPKFDVGMGVFVLSEAEKVERAWNRKEREIIKPYYTTREIDRYYANPENGFWVLYTGAWINRVISEYPNVKRHLDQFKSIITSVNKPYGLHRTREENVFLGEKILSVRKCAQPSFAYVDFPCYVARTFLVLKSTRINLKYLLGILNSKLAEFWLREKGKLQGNMFQIDKVPILSIPVKLAREQQQTAVIKFVDAILEAKSADAAADTSELEREIDERVYDLYGLTAAEIKIVEGK